MSIPGVPDEFEELMPCSACPDGYVWDSNGPTCKPCPVCKGYAAVGYRAAQTEQTSGGTQQRPEQANASKPESQPGPLYQQCECPPEGHHARCPHDRLWSASAVTDGPAADPTPVAYRYRFTDPITGVAVWRNECHMWNGQRPDQSEPLYSAAALDRLRAERDIGRALVKDLCEEWNEKCDCYERGVSKFEGHDDKCKSANLGEAKRALRERAERAEAERDALREVVRAADAIVADVRPTRLHDMTANEVAYGRARAKVTL